MSIYKLGLAEYKHIGEINNLYKEEYIASSEGLLGAAGKGVAFAGRTVRDTYQMGKKASGKIIELLKKVLASFGDMIQQMLVDLGKQDERMVDILGKLLQLEKKIAAARDEDTNKKEGEDAAPQKKFTDEVKYNIITAQSLTLSGWNPAKDMIPEDPTKPGSRMTKNPVAILLESIAFQNDNGDFVFEALRYKRIGDATTLYNAIQSIYEFSRRIVTESEVSYLFKQMSNFNGNMPSQGRIMDLLRVYPYMWKYPQNVGRYVAMAVSPFGAFMSLKGNKESFNNASKRKEMFKNLLTPLETTDVPGSVIKKESMQVVKMTAILMQYLLDLQVLEGLKQRRQVLLDFNKTVERFKNMSETQIKAAKTKASSKGVNGGALTYDRATAMADKMEDSDYNGGKTGGQASAQSYDPVQEAIMNELIALGEAIGGTNNISVNDAIGEVETNARNAMNGANPTMDVKNRNQYQDGYRDMRNSIKGDGTAQHYVDNRTTYNGNVMNALHKPKLMQDYQVTPEMQQYGLEYLYQIILNIANVSFEEGRFYNMLTKIMCDVMENFIEEAEDIFGESDEVKKASIEYNNNQNNTNNQTNNEDKPAPKDENDGDSNAQ